jgi:hypothetical protein
LLWQQPCRTRLPCFGPFHGWSRRDGVCLDWTSCKLGCYCRCRHSHDFGTHLILHTSPFCLCFLTIYLIFFSK